MMKKLYLFFTLFTFVLCFIGCSKDDSGIDDNTPENKPGNTPEKPEVQEKRENYAADVFFIDPSKVDSVSIKNDTTIVLYTKSHFKDNLKAGEKFVYSKDNSAEDYFVGIVKSVDVSGKTYTIHTEIPSFSDIFSELNITPEFKNTNVIVNFTPDDEDNVIYNGIVDNSVWDEIETISLAQDSTPSTRSALDRATTLPIDLTFSFSAKPNQAFDGNIYLRLKGNMHIYNDGNYELSVKQIVGIQGSFSLKLITVERRKIIPIVKTKNGFTLYSNKIAGIRLKPSLNFYFTGEIKLEAGFNYEIINTDNYVSYENGVFSNKSSDNLKDSYFRVKNLHTEAEFGLSLNTDLYAFIFSDKFFKGGVETVGGLAITGEQNVGIQFPDFANFDFSVRFSPFLEITPFVAIRTNTLKRFEGPTFKVTTEAFTVDLLPNIHDINYKRRQQELKVSSKIENENTSFLKTKEDGIALFKEGEETPIVHKSTNTIDTSAGSPDVSFNIKPNENYEIAKYAQSEDGQRVYGEKIPVKAEDNGMREALIKLYQSTNGDNWKRNDNWCSDKPLEEWYGVSVNSLSTRYTLVLNDNNLSGKIKQTFPEGLLIELYCSDNQLTSLDVSGCTALEDLYCQYNQLTSLDVSGCTALEELDCYKNQLTLLDVSGCTALEELDCVDHQLTSLNVSGCTALNRLYCHKNLLTSLDVSSCTSLKNLNCYNNLLTSLNVSGCSALEELDCYKNQLTSLDVSGCTALEDLNCASNRLISLNVSGCTALEDLNCQNNQFTSLNVSGCTALKSLDYFNSQLASLDVSGCRALEELDCYKNQLTSLDVSGCTALKSIDCYKNQLTSLDVSSCSALQSLRCEDNQLTSLNASSHMSLALLFCYNNQLTSLDVSGCTALIFLWCNDNQLISLNVSGCTALEDLNCQNNKITSVIPAWFAQLKIFSHDVRYSYRSEIIDGEIVYIPNDNGVGWWYPGEPEKGSHKPD